MTDTSRLIMFRRAVACLAVGSFLLTDAAMSVAQEPETPHVVRVEEDWVALIRNPDQGTAAPQIVNVISPLPSIGSVFGMVEVNHTSAPSFDEGGIQVQGWVDDTMVASGYGDVVSTLHRSYDRLEYTVAMENDSTGISFELLNGRSRSWGNFGGSFTRCTIPVGNSTLEGYSPEFSVQETHVTHGLHRVEVMYLRETRYTWSDGDTTTDDTLRVIHQFRDLVQDVSVEEWDQNNEYYNMSVAE